MLAGRLQRYATPLAARMENPVRVRHDLPPAPGSGAALCRRLRASSRRSHRPAGQIQRQGRTQNWIKPGGKVSCLTEKQYPATLRGRKAQRGAIPIWLGGVRNYHGHLHNQNGLSTPTPEKEG